MRICHRSNENADSNLVVTGFPGTWIFTKRACTAIVKNENAEQAMRRLVSAMQPWPKLELGELVGFDTTYTAQTSGGSIMDYLMTIGAACDLGFRVRLAGKNADKKLLFEVYRPTADPNNRFSTKWGNLQQAAWAFGDSDYANVAVVQGAGEGENRATVTVGLTDATGATGGSSMWMPGMCSRTRKRARPAGAKLPRTAHGPGHQQTAGTAAHRLH